MGINRTPHTFGAEAATSSLMNDEVKALWDGLQAGWDSYTPGWTATGSAPSIGNGFRSGLYRRVGKDLKWRIAFQFGSTTNFGTGFYRFELPFELDWVVNDAIGSASVYDDSTGDVYGFTAVYAGLTSGTPYVRLYGSTGVKGGATTPITLGTSDKITLSGIGELT